MEEFEVFAEVKGRISSDFLRWLDDMQSLDEGVDMLYLLFSDRISLLIGPF